MTTRPRAPPSRDRTRLRRAARELRHVAWDTRAEPHDRFGLLLGLLVTVFVLSAFTGRVVHAVTVLLNIVMLLVAFRATGLRRFHHLTTVAVIGLCGTAVARVLSDDQYTVIVASWSQAVVLAAILVATVVRVLQHKEVHLQTLLGAFSAYFLIGLVFSWLYLGLNQIGTPFFGTATSEAEFPYFSFITLTTVGFGDYVAVGRFNQRLVVIEALVGQIFLASLVARLVTLYGRRRPEQTPPGAGAVPGLAPDPGPGPLRSPTTVTRPGVEPARRDRPGEAWWRHASRAERAARPAPHPGGHVARGLRRPGRRPGDRHRAGDRTGRHHPGGHPLGPAGSGRRGLPHRSQVGIDPRRRP